MFEKFSLEHQVNKRIGSFLHHKATEDNIEAGKARLLFKWEGNTATVHLYDGNRYVKPIAVPSILEFFGTDYLERHQVSLNEYLEKVCKEQKIAPEHLNIIICEVKGALGAHIYEGVKYRQKISTVGLVAHFLKQGNE